MKNGVKSKQFFEYFPEKTFFYDGEELDIMKNEVWGSVYRAQLIKDIYDINDVQQGLRSRKKKREKVFQEKTLGLDSKIFVENQYVTFNKFIGFPFLKKTSTNKVHLFNTVQSITSRKFCFRHGRKFISVISCNNINSLKSFHAQTERIIEIFPKKIIMNVEMRIKSADSESRYRCGIAFNKLRRSERIFKFFVPKHKLNIFNSFTSSQIK